MNHDENKPEVQTWIEPELEARVVAWVAGEASAFEAAELERLVGENPELAIFKRRIETVHGLVAVAVRPDQEPLRLAPDRRASLLQTLVAADAPSAAEVPKKSDAPAVFPLYGARQQRRVRWRRNATIAAGLMLGLFFSTLIKYSSSKHDYAMERSPLAERAQYRAEDAVVDGKRARMLRESAADAAERAKQASIKLENRRGSRDDRQMPVALPSVEKNESSVHSAPAGQNVINETVAAAPPRSEILSGGEVITLSPFEVSSGRNQGYLASNSLSGSRISPPPPSAPKGFGYGGKDKFEKEVDSVAAITDVTKPSDNWSSRSAPADLPAMQFAAKKTKADQQSIFFSEVLEAPHDRETSAVAAFNFDGAAAAGPSAGKVALSESSPAGPPLATSPAPAQKPSAEAKALADSDEGLSGEKKNGNPLPKPVEMAEPDLTREVSAAKQPVSTFSLHVSDVSFRLAQAALASGEMPDPERIRPEEFYNAFNYGDPAPAMAEKITCRIEQSAHPTLQQRNLVRIAMKVPAVGRGAAQPLRLTVMLDTSGSMEREDRAAAVHRAMESLVSLLGPNDRLTVIGFARQPRLLVDQLPGDKAGEALTTIAHTPAEGGTDLEAALKLASELAVGNKESGAQNRIVLLTDGAANLGDADPAQLASSVEALRQQGIAFDACCVGLDGIDDAMLERLTRKGDGRHYVLNTPEAADAGFARQLAGAFRPAAENVKVQVRFNSARVGAYRLIGFEQHRLKEEDFRNDQVDAAELAADEAAVAVYQVETLPQGEGDVGEVYVRFRDASNGNMVERSWTMSYDPQVAAFDGATPTMQLAGVSALMADKLRGGPSADAIKLSEFAPVVNTLRGRYRNEPRVQELVTMYEQLRRLKGE